MTRRGLPLIGTALLAVSAFSCCLNLGWHSRGRTNESLNAVLWTQTSAEYQAAAEQGYRLARLRLDEALEHTSTWTAALEQSGDYSSLDPAIIVDVDETVLDNSPFQARLVKRNAAFGRETWHAWVREQKARAVPGALEFLRYAAGTGVKVFYVSNREHAVEEATRRNLEALGFPVDRDGSNLLTKKARPEWGSDKSSRRAFVARRYRVLLIVGDNLNDFVPGVKADPEQRVALVRRYRSYWGERWITIPNPMYGSWDRALYGFHGTLPHREILRLKYERLTTLE
jgi:acid phosphatase